MHIKKLKTEKSTAKKTIKLDDYLILLNLLISSS
jgi:hypothetical protein